MLDDNDIYLEQDFEVQFIIHECVVPDGLEDEADYSFHLLVTLPTCVHVCSINVKYKTDNIFLIVTSNGT